MILYRGLQKDMYGWFLTVANGKANVFLPSKGGKGIKNTLKSIQWRLKLNVDVKYDHTPLDTILQALYQLNAKGLIRLELLDEKGEHGENLYSIEISGKPWFSRSVAPKAAPIPAPAPEIVPYSYQFVQVKKRSLWERFKALFTSTQHYVGGPR